MKKWREECGLSRGVLLYCNVMAFHVRTSTLVRTQGPLKNVEVPVTPVQIRLCWSSTPNIIGYQNK